MRIDTTPHREANSQEDRVAIAAAVRALFGPTAAIRSIGVVGCDRDQTWTREGRLAIQTSHRMADPLIAIGRERRAK